LISNAQGKPNYWFVPWRCVEKSQPMTLSLMENTDLKVTLAVKCGIARKVCNMGSPFYFGLHFCNCKEMPKTSQAGKTTKIGEQTMHNAIAIEATNNVTACLPRLLDTIKTRIKKAKKYSFLTMMAQEMRK